MKPEKYSMTDEEFAEKMHEMYVVHIYSSKSMVRKLASLGSNVCKRIMKDWKPSQKRRRCKV